MTNITTRSQKRKAVTEFVSGEFETSVSENNQPQNMIAGPRKPPRVQPEKMEEMKTSLRKEIMSNLARILAENQREMMKLVAPKAKKPSARQNNQDTDSETENITVAQTSTPVKTNTATSKTTPMNSRSRMNVQGLCHLPPFSGRWDCTRLTPGNTPQYCFKAH